MRSLALRFRCPRDGWRRGELPFWNQYIFSGTPLLAGFNAGALHPLVGFFPTLPDRVAWIATEVVLSFLIAVGMYLFLRCAGRRHVLLLGRGPEPGQSRGHDRRFCLHPLQCDINTATPAAIAASGILPSTKFKVVNEDWQRSLRREDIEPEEMRHRCRQRQRWRYGNSTYFTQGADGETEEVIV